MLMSTEGIADAVDGHTHRMLTALAFSDGSRQQEQRALCEEQTAAALPYPSGAGDGVVVRECLAKINVCNRSDLHAANFVSLLILSQRCSMRRPHK